MCFEYNAIHKFCQSDNTTLYILCNIWHHFLCDFLYKNTVIPVFKDNGIFKCQYSLCTFNKEKRFFYTYKLLMNYYGILSFSASRRFRYIFRSIILTSVYHMQYYTDSELSLCCNSVAVICEIHLKACCMSLVVPGHGHLCAIGLNIKLCIK